jgi:uncharacterized protein YjbI with pentapeptide repeats
VNLNGVNLKGAKLSDALLIDANLAGATLEYASLNGTNLRDANLAGANLTGAYLSDALVVDATLKGANLTEALLGGAVFANTDLTGVIGLETCKHSGPSSVDSRILERFDRLPLSFVRGVDLPERLSICRRSLTKRSSIILVSSATRPRIRSSLIAFTPIYRTRGCGVGSRRMTCRLAEKYLTRLIAPFVCETSCC